MPDQVSAFLKNKCYDYHSNHTRYPWYYHIQPIRRWMYPHIDEGRKELNFSEFGSYPERRALHKLEETAELVHEREMPLREYLWMHPEARVSE